MAEHEADDDDHAARMDGVYRYQRHIYDLTRKYYLFGRDRLVRQLQARTDERLVEVGCGTARNLIRIARAYPGCRLYGLDASREMLRTAEEAVRRAGLSEQITLAYGYAEEMTPALFGARDNFDHAIFSYSLSMIPDWPAALRAGVAVLRPQGTVNVVDFGDFARLPPPFARALRAWLRRFHVQPRVKLLKVLENARVNESSMRLDILPGRYAFVLKARPSIIRHLETVAVAD